MFSTIACLTLFLLFLVLERSALIRWRRRIPLRIAVTGTRGKSGIARILASILTEDGRRVLAKTTGSEAMLLLPDGSEAEVRRRGIPSIREQIHLVHQASRLGADCLVCEIMSLHPENHRFESRILNPDIVVITNVRRDHTETMGETEEDIASVLALDIPPNASVFLPDHCPQAPFAEAAERLQAKLVKVCSGSAAPLAEIAPELAAREFAENLDLVYSVARHLNIDDAAVLRGIAKARHDVGGLKIWRACTSDRSRSYYLVNAFAANDPQSTLQALGRVLQRIPGASDKVVGVLSLRSDRGPRTLQWIEALERGGMQRFARLFVTGSHSGIVRRRLPAIKVLAGGSAEEMTAAVTSDLPDGSVIFGFGNIKGAGLQLVNLWSKMGTDYGI